MTRTIILLSRYLGKVFCRGKNMFEFYKKAHITKNMAYPVFDPLILCSLHDYILLSCKKGIHNL